jgi:hypothetical protein
LHDIAFARRKSLHVVSLKDHVLHDQIHVDDLIERIVTSYVTWASDYRSKRYSPNSGTIASSR